jgi:hypothetical protein
LLIGFLLGLLSDPEDGCNMFLQNVSWLSPDYTSLCPRRQITSQSLLWESQVQHNPYHRRLHILARSKKMDSTCGHKYNSFTILMWINIKMSEKFSHQFPQFRVKQLSIFSLIIQHIYVYIHVSTKNSTSFQKFPWTTELCILKISLRNMHALLWCLINRAMNGIILHVVICKVDIPESC